VQNPVNAVISFAVLAVIVGGSFYYVYALAPRGPWMGIVSGTYLNPQVSEILGLEQDSGILVFTVAPQSPAEKAGLRGGGAEIVEIGGQRIPVDGDIIVSMDGRQIVDEQDVCAVLGQKQAGDSVRVGASRDGSLLEFNVMLEESPPGESSGC
jgi:S1-C subfamily serine protease